MGQLLFQAKQLIQTASFNLHHDLLFCLPTLRNVIHLTLQLNGTTKSATADLAGDPVDYQSQRARLLLHWVCLAMFWKQGVAGVASVRSCCKFPPYPAEQIPANSKMDVSLARVWPIRNDGNPYMIIYLRRRGKKKGIAQI